MIEVTPPVVVFKVSTSTIGPGVPASPSETPNLNCPSSFPFAESTASAVIRANSWISSASFIISNDIYISSPSTPVLLLLANVATLLAAVLALLATSNPPCVAPVAFLISTSANCILSRPLLYLIEEPDVIFTSWP